MRMTIDQLVTKEVDHINDVELLFFFTDLRVEVGDAEDVIKQWEMLKTTEKDGNKRVLSGVPDGLPPLLKAYRMQDKARGVGFDWEKKEDVWEKVKEELGEYQAELDAMVVLEFGVHKSLAILRILCAKSISTY